MVNDNYEFKNDALNKDRSVSSNQDDDKQILFRFFGVEMTAPKGLKNPRIVYISFIVINFILLIALKRLTMN